MRFLFLHILKIISLLLCAVSLGSADHVAILISEENETFLKIAANAASVLHRDFPTQDIQIIKMWEKDGNSLSKEFLACYPKVTFAVGRPAAVYVQTYQTFPFVYALVLDPYKVGLLDTQSKNLGLSTGILTKVDPEMQLMRLRAEIPGGYKLGTLYLPTQSLQNTQESELARRLGFELHSRLWTGKFENFCIQFKTLIKQEKIDTFWFRESHLSKDIFDYLVEFCQLYHLNLLTFNPNHVEQGATLAVSIDYEKLGFQAAAILSQILRGVPAEKIPVQYATQAKTLFLKKNLYSQEK